MGGHLETAEPVFVKKVKGRSKSMYSSENSVFAPMKHIYYCRLIHLRSILTSSLDLGTLNVYMRLGVFS